MTTTARAGRIAVRVYGVPVPQGSKRIGRRAGRPVILDNNDGPLTTWRKRVEETAYDATRYHDVPLAGPVKAWIRFTFERPASHWRAGRNAHLLKDTAPAYPGHGCGDVDKLLRAILDALTGPVLTDDTQVIDVRARKFYAGEDEYALDRAGVDIIIEPLTGQGVLL